MLVAFDLMLEGKNQFRKMYSEALLFHTIFDRANLSAIHYHLLVANVKTLINIVVEKVLFQITYVFTLVNSVI